MTRRKSYLTSMFLFLFCLACSQVQGDDQEFAKHIRQAERILIGTTPQTSDLSRAGNIPVRIDRVLRGRGRKGQTSLIVHDGGQRAPQFEAEKQYVFLLKKTADGEAWLYIGDHEIAYREKTFRIPAADGSTREITLDDFQGLIDDNPTAPEATLPQRKSLAGDWVLKLTQQEQNGTVWDSSLCIIHIAEDEGDFKAELVASNPDFRATQISSFSIVKDNVQLVFEATESGSGQEFQFQGTFNAGIVYGNLSVSKKGVQPARLTATSTQDMAQYQRPRPPEGREDFYAAFKEDDPYDDFQGFIKQYPNSPLLLIAYQVMLRTKKAESLDASGMEQLIADYLRVAGKGGTRLENLALTNVAFTLATSKKFPDLTLKYLNEAHSRITDESPLYWKQALRFEKATLFLSLGKKQEAVALLQANHEEFPFDPRTTYQLAHAVQEQEHLDQALELYAEIVALPSLEQTLLGWWSQSEQNSGNREAPSETVSKLWRQKHGDTQGLDDYITEVYSRAVHAFVKEKVEPRRNDEGTRVVLCELFTGAFCPPCQGADIATSGLEAAFAKSEVIVLRYHQHIPAPDPLTGPDNFQRFAYYNGRGTPTLTINGKDFAGAPGFLSNSENLYHRLRQRIEPILLERIDLGFKLQARADDGWLELSAEAVGRDEFQDHVRMRLALVEDEIPFIAGNGIRLHEMVVRAMPGGPRGIKPEEGKLNFRRKINLADFRETLDNSLSEFEGRPLPKFRIKPLELKKLHLVAFLQDDSTQEILQAAAIPVTGKITFSAGGQ